MKSSRRAAVALGTASFTLGIALGFLGQFEFAMQLPLIFSGYSPLLLLTTWAALAVSYPLTFLVFYALGRRHQLGIRAASGVLTTYGGAFLGEVVGQTIFIFFPQGNVPFVFPFTYLRAVPSSLTLLFVGLSGFTLSSLRHSDASALASHRRGDLAVTLTVMAFSLEGSFFVGALSLNVGWFSNPSFVSSILGLNFFISLPLQFIVFYYVGRRIPVNGRTLRYLGLLFVGAYAGTVVGAVIGVTLFGQSLWTLPSGTGSMNLTDGIVYRNVPTSLRLILQSLNPIHSLPFLPFFAMSVSRMHPDIGDRERKVPEQGLEFSMANPGVPVAAQRAGSEPARRQRHSLLRGSGSGSSWAEYSTATTCSSTRSSSAGRATARPTPSCTC